jgi:hypothetical protein
MYFTADTGADGREAKIGVSFSQDGKAWVVHPEPVLSWWGTLNPGANDYGAGMSGISFDPSWIDTSTWTPVLAHVYFDDSFATTGDETIRFRGTSNGTVWFMAPGPPYETTLGSQVNVGHNPDVAYRMEGNFQRWYAVVTDFEDGSSPPNQPTRVRILRSTWGGSIHGARDYPWVIIGTIDQSLTGGSQNNNPGFAKHPDGRLLEENGWGYIFVTTGPHNPTQWKIDQVRFSLP